MNEDQQYSAPSVLWLWRNFVDGKPEYWAFDNPYPCHENGDPMTLGEPCGYAKVKESKNGRQDVSPITALASLLARGVPPDQSARIAELEAENATFRVAIDAARKETNHGL